MGKVKRQRKKLHYSSKNKNQETPEEPQQTINTSPFRLTIHDKNIFSEIDINFDNIKQTLSDDTRSIRSYKSLKSEKGGKILPKKDKLKLRRQLLLNKMDALAQKKAELKMREKRKNLSVIGDTNPLHDALPSLSTLLSKSDARFSKNKQPVKKNVLKKLKSRRKGPFKKSGSSKLS